MAMADPYLVKCLATLRAEFNALSPNRDKGSDGWIGDAAHQAETSDHNPRPDGRVLALDIDSTGPWPAPFGDMVESLRGDSRLEYVIWNRRIASRSQGWTWRTYTGTSDPHTGHAHFSARHDLTGNTSTAPWGLEDFDMELSDDQIAKIAAAVWQYRLTDQTDGVAKQAGTMQAWQGQVAVNQANRVIDAGTADADRIIEALTPAEQPPAE
jgi:hypothetical protein